MDQNDGGTFASANVVKFDSIHRRGFGREILAQLWTHLFLCLAFRKPATPDKQNGQEERNYSTKTPVRVQLRDHAGFLNRRIFPQMLHVISPNLCFAK